MGQDGNLYAIGGTVGGSKTTISVYNPATLALVKTVNVPGTDDAAVTADAAGDIFVGVFGDKLYKTDPSGNVLTTAPIAAEDLAISTDGKILASSGGPTAGKVTVTVLDTSLTTLSSFTVGTVPGSEFISWADNQSFARPRRPPRRHRRPRRTRTRFPARSSPTTTTTARSTPVRRVSPACGCTST